ncbi:4-hydroxy-3-methylbut-2-enyl diphosphate reductase [Chlorobium sp. N1]|uniref:4-hydroxy-3-methylbut-2-enyl diphosphate reductase n=1 Tax=Chlorobium sp. N1 TaxID=2491138 RepID=UPI0010396A3F|nr:4-hydroxy-3-methylbut-2-enyl diphosphate reductase [Chlorobium sp. N1]TCD48867.1 4-hydroxy-3-methylbut-2-enyl diphosphate reductase [Chlorobium sp. N1]
MKINLDRTSSGFCFGVQSTIDVAEEKLRQLGSLYALGDVVHNEVEVKRLEALGLITIDLQRLERLHNAPVLIRAHGEPPSTFRTAGENNISVTDTTCPVVARLQERARQLRELGYQVIIYGKKSHPEVVAINGHCGGTAVIIRHADLSDGEELRALDFSKKSALISQTTMDVPGFELLRRNLEELFMRESGNSEAWQEVKDADIKAALKGERELGGRLYRDTICRQVSNRNDGLRAFARGNDVVIFVAGRKSSNGQMLYNICREANPESHFIEDVEEIDPEWFRLKDGGTAESVGVCGATSTPMWLLEKVAASLESLAAEG